VTLSVINNFNKKQEALERDF